MKNASEYVVEEEDFDITARPQTDADSPVTRSWESVGNTESENNGYATDFKFQTDDIQIVRFVDAFPPISYKEHWLSSKTSGKRSYTCLNPKGRPDVTCPLCQMDREIPGQFPKAKFALTVVNLSVNPFQRQLMVGGKRLSDGLFALDTNKNIGPLVGKCWAVNKSGEKQNTQYHFTPVKDRDLKEDWNIDPDEAKKFFDSVEAYPDSIIKSYSVAELREIASALS